MQDRNVPHMCYKIETLQDKTSSVKTYLTVQNKNNTIIFITSCPSTLFVPPLPSTVGTISLWLTLVTENVFNWV